ncbi:MFS transporter [Exilibacterium tricleocarpae]|uniref:MFS transporter n=1 Tax=Exilibacterium tricleocarpae TaxID=2591008 RepID=A0A545TK75_9GAMM|nr:MFS transporter [Exilibacterium tricleocarpae]TQV77615.1 MFS transporter [Exilibacterium tricleocarpae]
MAINSDSPSIRAGALALYTAGGLFWAFLPYFIGLQTDAGGLSQTQAGSLGSGYLLGFTLASAGALWWVPRFNWRRVNLAGAVIIIAALAVLQDTDSYSVSLLAVIAVGVMMGSFWAIYYRIFAATANPDRNYAIGIVVSYTVLAVVSYVIGSYIIPASGLKGAAYTLGVAIILLASIGLLIPKNLAEEKVEAGYSYRPSRSIVLALIGILTTGLAFASVWAFAERIGVTAGLSRDAVSPVIASNLLAAAAGSVLATLLGTRLGRRFSLFAGFIVMAVAVFMLFGATSVWLYAGGLIGLGFGIGFVMPYQMALIAVLDSKGHFVVLIAAVQGLGSAAGPLLGGLAADISGVDALLVFVLCTLALSAVAFALVGSEVPDYREV